jgi:hypothetical protein
MNDTELDDMLNRWMAPDVPASMGQNLRRSLRVRPARKLLGVRLRRWLPAFVAAVGALAIGASLVHDGSIGSDSGPWDTGTYMRRTRIVQPFLAKFRWSGAGGLSTGWQWQQGKLVGSVYLFDKSNRQHYGYTWNAEPLGSGQYRFTVLPLDPSVLREDGPVAPPPHSAPPAVVGPGSTFEVDIKISENERVYDRYELSKQSLPLPQPGTLDLMTLTNPRLYVNGALALDSDGVAQASGDRVFVDLQNRGEYVLTLDPRNDPRFQRAGTAKDNTIEFRSHGDDFRITCTAPVTRNGDRAVYLYVKEDVNIRTSRFGSGGGTVSHIDKH